MANRVDPDQTAPPGAVWSGSALFAYAILSETFVFKILGIYDDCFLFAVQSTTDVISQARHNLEQSQKRRSSPKSSPKAGIRHWSCYTWYVHLCSLKSRSNKIVMLFRTEWRFPLVGERKNSSKCHFFFFQETRSCLPRKKIFQNVSIDILTPGKLIYHAWICACMYSCIKYTCK